MLTPSKLRRSPARLPCSFSEQSHPCAIPTIDAIGFQHFTASPAATIHGHVVKMRTDMLSTGIRTTLGLKIFGSDLVAMDTLAKKIEPVLRTVPGTFSPFAKRISGCYSSYHRAGSAATGSLRHQRRRVPGQDRHGVGRRNGDYHGGGPGAIQRQCPLPTRVEVAWQSRIRVSRISAPGPLTSHTRCNCLCVCSRPSPES